MRVGFGFRLNLLIRALLAANPGKRLPQIGFNAVGVTERTVEYRFHAVSFAFDNPRRTPPAAAINAKCLPYL